MSVQQLKRLLEQAATHRISFVGGGGDALQKRRDHLGVVVGSIHVLPSVANGLGRDAAKGDHDLSGHERSGARWISASSRVKIRVAIAPQQAIPIPPIFTLGERDGAAENTGHHCMTGFMKRRAVLMAASNLMWGVSQAPASNPVVARSAGVEAPAKRS